MPCNYSYFDLQYIGLLLLQLGEQAAAIYNKILLMVLIRDRALWLGFYLLPQRYFCDFDNTPFHFPFQPRENCNSGQ